MFPGMQRVMNAQEADEVDELNPVIPLCAVEGVQGPVNNQVPPALRRGEGPHVSVRVCEGREVVLNSWGHLLAGCCSTGCVTLSS